jgi:hypothetical protein
MRGGVGDVGSGTVRRSVRSSNVAADDRTSSGGVWLDLGDRCGPDELERYAAYGGWVPTTGRVPYFVWSSATNCRSCHDFSRRDRPRVPGSPGRVALGRARPSRRFGCRTPDTRFVASESNLGHNNPGPRCVSMISTLPRPGQYESASTMSIPHTLGRATTERIPCFS